MKERPILFSAPMVRALLAGTKTQTRRIVKPAIPSDADEAFFWQGPTCPEHRADRGCQHVAQTGLWARKHGVYGWLRFQRPCPYGVPGDTLWVRETWAGTVPNGIDYRADGHDYGHDDEGRSLMSWRPSIHMPRWASRLTLTLTDVRVERLQEIGEADAIAEGCDWAAPQPYGETWDDDREDPREVGYANPTPENGFARDNYRRLWESINGPGSWDANPWVWVLSFTRAESTAARGAA